MGGTNISKTHKNLERNNLGLQKLGRVKYKTKLIISSNNE
jgi:hypothetical protein